MVGITDKDWCDIPGLISGDTHPTGKIERIRSIDKAFLKQILKEAQTPSPPEGLYEPTCVFLLIFNKPETYLLAILKADTEGYPWRNQVALPGGHIDANDASPADAVFRELKEELNIPNEQVELIGSMGHFQTINHKDIEVFIGLWNGLGPVRYETREIAKVLEIPLQVLEDIHLTKNYHAQRNDLQQFIYPIDDLTIWGATARILHYFIELLHPAHQ